MKRKEQDETEEDFCIALFFLIMRESWQNQHMKKGKAYGTSY